VAVSEDWQRVDTMHTGNAPLVFAGFGVDVLLLVLIFLLPWGVDVPPVLLLLSVVVLAWGVDVFIAFLLASVCVLVWGVDVFNALLLASVFVLA